MAQFAGGVSYTPFMQRGAGVLREAMMGRRERGLEKQKNELAANAYMGNPEALQELAAMDPQMAMQVEDQAAERKARGQQADLRDQTMEENRRQFAIENRELMQELMVNIGGFENYEQAAAYTAGQVGQLESIMGEGQVPLGELTPEQHQQFRTLYQAANQQGGWEKSGGPQLELNPETNRPHRVQTFVNEQGQTMTVPVGLGVALTSHDPELASDIAGAKQEGKTQEERAQIAIDAGTAAAATLPNINRALGLLADTETAGWKEYANQLQQFVGYEGEETADLAELQQLLAAQMFDTLSNFRGAISNTELATARQLSTGLGKNTEANRRILLALQQRLGRAVEIGRAAATERDDVVALEMLDGFDPFAASVFETPDAGGGGATGAQDAAPAAALEYLRENPETVDQFEATYGYRPEGF